MIGYFKEVGRCCVPSSRRKGLISSRHVSRTRLPSLSSWQGRLFSSSGGGDNKDDDVIIIDEDGGFMRMKVISKLGMGSHRWTQLMNAETEDGSPPYHEVMETALINGINVLEVGQEVGGDMIMSSIVSKTNSLNGASLLRRIGYRTVVFHNEEKKQQQQDQEDNKYNIKEMNDMSPLSSRTLLPGDLQLEQLPTRDDDSKVMVVHNISRPAIRAILEESPLCQPGFIRKHPDVNMTLMLHNPEVQGRQQQSQQNDDTNLITPEQRNARICDKLTEAFLAVEQEIDERRYKTMLQSYGIVSNGLGLPQDHPLHLSWSNAIFSALKQTQEELQRPLKFDIVQLPLNLLETTSLQAARQIKRDRPETQIYVMRPLTAYPNGGTGSSAFPIHFSDLELAPSMANPTRMKWTNQMTAPPDVYQAALQVSMQYFDAEEILQEQIKGKQLTVEQRETLDGCKLLQSLLHDLDAALDTAKSWELHEHELMTKIIPLIQDTFEAYDDETAETLEKYFHAYSITIRYYIAHNTRKLLLHGDDSGNFSSSSSLPPPTYPDLPPSKRLQDYALQFILSQGDLVDKIIVGCANMDQVIQNMEIVHQYLISQTSPKSN